MGAAKGGQTIGYKYLMSLHMGIGRGPVNQLKEIRVGDLKAWDTAVCTNDGGALIEINAPDLFGGDEKEGGIQGPAYILNGDPDQELPGSMSSGLGTLPSIAASLGGDVPNFRNVVTVWFDGEVCAINPYPKEWAFRVQRSSAGWADDDCWYPSKSTIYMTGPQEVALKLAVTKGDIFRAAFAALGGTKAKTAIMNIQGNIGAMNGAHILYECATNPDWGRGLPRAMMDDNSYTYAANQLCDEGFGLCLPWFRQESVKTFSQMVLDHIGGAQYVDRETGKMTLRLIRADYDPDDLPLYTPSTGLLSIEEDDASSQEQAFNEIIVTGFDPNQKMEFSVRAQNLASIQSLGVIISNTIQYKGIPTRDLAARVAMKELKAQTGVRRFNVRLDRRAWRLAPAGLFRISHPGRGIANLVLRVGQLTELDAVSGEIQVIAVQDVFGLPTTSYFNPQAPGWSPADFTASPPVEHRLYELSYRDVFRKLDRANREALTDDVGIIGELAEQPTPSSQSYDLATKTAPDDYVIRTTRQDFTATLVLSADIAALDTELVVDPAGVISWLTEYVDGMAAMLDNEIVQLVSFDEDTNTFTITRGNTDTIPAPHMAGVVLWLIDDDIGVDGVDYVSGETVYAKALTRTASDLLTLDEGEEDSIVLVGRFARPYPPGNVKVDGVSIYLSDGAHTEPVLTWAHRDRIAEADALLGHLEASTGPEAGTTYTVRVYDPADLVTPLREETLIAGTTWTYDSTMQAADTPPNVVRIELESARDSLASTFRYAFNVTLNGGYGLGYGLNYGGGVV